MKVFVILILWCVLLVTCWPLAVLLMILVPLVWVILLPFRLAGVFVEAVFGVIKALLFLPARILGYRPRR